VGACAAALRGHPQIWALGVNCTPPRHVAGLLGNLSAAADKPLLVYPNSGESYDAHAKQWDGAAQGPAFAERTIEWYRAGARLIGGCCRSTPQDIRAIRATRDALQDSVV
jgi:homocysteine S-methyltransferase